MAKVAAQGVLQNQMSAPTLRLEDSTCMRRALAAKTAVGKVSYKRRPGCFSLIYVILRQFGSSYVY